MIFRYLDKNFRENKEKFIGQSILAGVSVGVALLFFDVIKYPMIVASFGASAFIAFTLPHSKMAGPRYLVGGYIVGVLVGCLIHFVTDLPVGFYPAQKMLYTIAGGLAVGLSMFIMTAFDAEHPPAAGIALGFVLNEWTFMTVVLVLAGIVVISTIQRILKPRMIDLL
ncbi:MAG: HPP family protein [Candidatus Omnitrophota bacterium]